MVMSCSGRERWTTMVGQANKQSRGEKGPGGPADHPETFERLREAWGDVTASRSCGESTAEHGGDSFDPGEAELLLKRRRKGGSGARPLRPTGRAPD
jgi:hypothetical protein